MTENRQPRIDGTRMDYAALREAMLALARERLPEWTDHSSNDLGVLLVELFCAMGDALFYHQDRIAAESYLETAVERRSVLHLLRLIGYELRPPVPSSADLTLLFKDETTTDQNDSVTIEPGHSFETTKEAAGQVIKFAYIRPEKLTISRRNLPLYVDGNGKIVTFPPSSQRYRFIRIPVVQVDASIAREIVTSSDGSKNQRYPLARHPLILDSLRIEVNDGAVTTAWNRKPTLLHSAWNDCDYVVRFDENDVAWIEFGDGNYGKVPPRGRNNIIATYRIGGGTKGNVPPFAISKSITTVAGLQKVLNEKAATGGADQEPLDEAVRKGPQQFRSMGRAVTAADYEFHAKASGFGVAKARAIATTWNRVQIYVAPVGGGHPSDTLKEDLRTYFESRRMLNTSVEIENPSYPRVSIEAEFEIEPRYSIRQVRQRVEDTVKALWAFDKVGFGETLYISKIYEVIEAIEGVRWVNITKFAREDSKDKLPSDGRLRFSAAEIPSCDGFSAAPAVTGGYGA